MGAQRQGLAFVVLSAGQVKLRAPEHHLGQRLAKRIEELRESRLSAPAGEGARELERLLAIQMLPA